MWRKLHRGEMGDSGKSGVRRHGKAQSTGALPSPSSVSTSFSCPLSSTPSPSLPRSQKFLSRPDLPPTFPPSIALCPCLSLSNSRSVSCLLPILSPQDHATSCFGNGSPPPPPAQTTPPTTEAINELPEGAHTWCGCDSHVPRDSRYLRPPPFPRAPQPWGPRSHSSQALGRLHGSRSRRNFLPMRR